MGCDRGVKSNLMAEIERVTHVREAGVRASGGWCRASCNTINFCLQLLLHSSRLLIACMRFCLYLDPAVSPTVCSTDRLPSVNASEPDRGVPSRGRHAMGTVFDLPPAWPCGACIPPSWRFSSLAHSPPARCRCRVKAADSDILIDHAYVTVPGRRSSLHASNEESNLARVYPVHDHHRRLRQGSVSFVA